MGNFIKNDETRRNIISKKPIIDKYVTIFSCVIFIIGSMYNHIFASSFFDNLTLIYFSLLMVLPLLYFVKPGLYLNLIQKFKNNIHTLTGRGCFMIVVGVLYLTFDLYYYKSNYEDKAIFHLIGTILLLIAGISLIIMDKYLPSEKIEEKHEMTEEVKIVNPQEKTDTVEKSEEKIDSSK